MEIAILILCGLNLVALLLLLLKGGRREGTDKSEIKNAVNESISSMSGLLLSNLENTNKLFSQSVNEKITELKGEMKSLNENNAKGYVDFIEKLNASLTEVTKVTREENEKASANLNARFEEFAKVMKERLGVIDTNVSKSLVELRRENT